MADPGMMSLFGDDGNLFSDELEGLGDCGYPQGQANPVSQQLPHEHQGYGQLPSTLHLSSPAVPGQAKLGHPFDHFNQYEQSKMHSMDQQGGRMIGNGPVNGMSSPHSRYHGPPPGAGGSAGHHVYPGAQGDGRSQSFSDGGNVWGAQAMQVPDQARPAFQQQPPQASSHQHGPVGPQGHAHQMGPFIGRGDYTMQGHNQTQTPPRMNHFPQGLPQEANHFMSHVGMTQNPGMSGPPMRHPAQPPPQHQQPNQQFLLRPGQGPVHPESVTSHNPQFPQSPSRQQQVMGGRPHQNMGYNMHNQQVPSNTVNSSGQYPPYPSYGNLNQGLANTSGMSPNLSLTTSSNSNPNAPVAPVQRYTAPTGPQRYPTPGAQQGPMHQQPIHVNQINTQPIHPAQNQVAAQQKLQQPHLPPPPQGSYASPPSMSPMRNLATPAGTPPPQQGRPPSVGLVTDVGGYPGVLHQSQGPMAHAQRGACPVNAAQQHPHQQLPSHPSHPHPPPTQMYAALSPNHRATGTQGRPPAGPGANHTEPQDQRLLAQQAQHQQLLTPPLPFQQQQVHTPPSIPPSQTHLAAHHQSSPPSQQAWAPPHQSPPPMQKVPYMHVSCANEACLPLPLKVSGKSMLCMWVAEGLFEGFS